MWILWMRRLESYCLHNHVHTSIHTPPSASFKSALSSFTALLCLRVHKHRQKCTKLLHNPAAHPPTHPPTSPHTPHRIPPERTQQRCITWEWARNTWQSFANEHCSAQRYAEICWNVFYNVSRHQRQFNSLVISQTPLPNKTHILSSLLHWQNNARHHC